MPIYANKVGPYYNTHETYHYYSLPVCRPNKVRRAFAARQAVYSARASRPFPCGNGFRSSFGV